MGPAVGVDDSDRPRPDLSPTVNHRHLVERLVPRLGYDGADASAWQQTLRGVLADLIGLTGMPPPGETTVRIEWVREESLGTIEKIVFPSEPGADIVGYFCRPHGVPAPLSVVICLQGHTTGMHLSIARTFDEAAPIDVDGDRDFALGAMRHGYAALCIEQRGFGLRREQQQVSPHSCHDAAMHALMLGRTLLGERVYDVDRGIDYLAGRGDVDMARVGVLGNSGGGTVGMYAAALLDRIRFAVPSCSFSTFADSIMNVYHCADNYVPGLMLWAEAADVLGLFAPKPVVVVAGRQDPLFPIDGVTTAFASLGEIYAAAGAPDHCRLVVGDGGHRFYAKEAWQALTELL